MNVHVHPAPPGVTFSFPPHELVCRMKKHVPVSLLPAFLERKTATARRELSAHLSTTAPGGSGLCLESLQRRVCLDRRHAQRLNTSPAPENGVSFVAQVLSKQTSEVFTIEARPHPLLCARDGRAQGTDGPAVVLLFYFVYLPTQEGTCGSGQPHQNSPQREDSNGMLIAHSSPGSWVRGPGPRPTPPVTRYILLCTCVCCRFTCFPPAMYEYPHTKPQLLRARTFTCIIIYHLHRSIKPSARQSQPTTPETSLKPK